MFSAQGLAQRPEALHVDQRDRAPAARVLGAAPRIVRLRAPLWILRIPRVQRPVRAPDDVNEVHKGMLPWLSLPACLPSWTQLTNGACLGFYAITASLGAGGMGEVYRARDTRLDREVAIKVLPEVFVADPERVARFTREAKTLAALNHPNIASIYGLAEANRVSGLVAEWIEGPTLAGRV